MFHLPMVQRRYVITPPGWLSRCGPTITDLLRGVHLLMPASPKVGERVSRKSGTSATPSLDLAGKRRPKWAERYRSVARKATLRAPPRLFGPFHKRCFR